MSTSDFSNLHTKIPHDKLLAVLNSVIEFAFRSGARHKICALNNKAYWIKNNSQMNGNHYSLISLKQAVKYLVENGFFKVGSQIFGQIIDIPMGSDTASFFSNLFLFHYKS